jgi:hypothetical protein
VYVSDVPTYRLTRGHGKETGTEIHLTVNTRLYFSPDDGGGDGDDDDDDNDNDNNNNTSKSIPLQAWSGPEGSRKLRFTDFTTTAQNGANAVSLTHRPPLPPGNTLGTHFC